MIILLLTADAYQATNGLRPGAMRRTIFGNGLSQKVHVPSAVLEQIARSTECSSLKESLPFFSEAISTLAKTGASVTRPPFNRLPSLPGSTAEETLKLKYVNDCLRAQQRLRTKPLPKFMKVLTPGGCGVDPNDRASQLKFLHDHANEIGQAKFRHGCVYFKGWSAFSDNEGLEASSHALGMSHCEDPFAKNGIRSQLDGSSIVFEASNRQEDARTHIGMHTDASPDRQPNMGLFACFQAAISGGEFLLCDGRRAVRDLDSITLKRFEEKKIRPIFVDIPEWMSVAPGPFKRLPFSRLLQAEAIALFTDLVKPEDNFFIDALPNRNMPSSSPSLALTMEATSPLVYHPITGEAVLRHNIDAAHKDMFHKRNPHAKKRQSSFDLTTFDHVHEDGSRIIDRDIDNVVKAIGDNTISLRMKPGDAVLVDNFMTLHGRKPFVGERKHAVVWSM